MPEWVTIQKLARDTGYTVPALRSKINRGDFIEGVHWKKTRDRRIHFNVKAYNAWVNGVRLELKNVVTA